MSQQSVIESIVAAARDPRFKESSDHNKSLLDEKILCKKVETALLKDMSLENPHFRIVADGRDITIAGHVQSQEELDNVLKCVARVKGVKQVVDELQVISYKSYKR
jgi:osmotically-inducible protein OsmY